MELKLSRNDNDLHTLYEHGLYAFIDYLDYRIENHEQRYAKHPILDAFEERSTIGKLYRKWIFTDVADYEFINISQEVIEAFIQSTQLYSERVESEYLYTFKERQYLRENRYSPENLISNQSIWKNKKQNEALIKALIHSNQEREDSLFTIRNQLNRYLHDIPEIIKQLEDQYSMTIKELD